MKPLRRRVVAWGQRPTFVIDFYSAIKGLARPKCCTSVRRRNRCDRLGLQNEVALSDCDKPGELNLEVRSAVAVDVALDDLVAVE